MGKAVAIFSFLTVFVITACTQLGISDISLLKRRGLAYMRTKRYDLALNDFYSAITLRPDAESFAYQGDALYNLGKPEMGRFDLAIRDYNKALKLVPKSAEALFGRGIAKQNSDDYAGASADVSAAETLDPHIKDVFLRWNVSLSVLQHSSVKQDGGREKTQTL
jgi:tetratricopeptide (TPR) repeat protein